METTACLDCGSDRHHVLFQGPDFVTDTAATFPVAQCLDCGLVYLRERPTPQEIGAYYPAHYAPYTTQSAAAPVVPLWKTGSAVKRVSTRWALAHWYGYPKVWNGGKTVASPGTHQRFLPRYRNIPFFKAGGRLLEFGCGTGVYLKRMQQLGWDVYGVEPGAAARQTAEDRGLPHVYPDLFAQQFADGFFDVVTAWQVIEHVHDPVAYLRELLRITKPGGQLLLSTISVRTPEAWLFRRYWHNWEIPRHLIFFTPETLTRLARKAGWADITVSHQTTPNSIIHSLRRWMKDRHPRWLDGILGRVIRLENNALQYLLWPLAMGIAFFHLAGRINLTAYRREDK